MERSAAMSFILRVSPPSVRQRAISLVSTFQMHFEYFCALQRYDGSIIVVLSKHARLSHHSTTIYLDTDRGIQKDGCGG